MRCFSVAVAALVFLAACGSDTTDAGSGDSEDFVSPIAEFLGQDTFSFDNSEEAQARFIADERERQELIAACMRREGFEYIPIDPEENNFFEEPGDLEFGSDEWVAKYGFGITTMWFSQEEVGPDLVGHDFGSFEDQIAADPNQAIVQEMSLSGQEAYYVALDGDQQFPEFDETLSEEELEAQFEDFDFQPSGCRGEAYNESSDPSFRFYEEFNDELEVMYERVETDSRFVEAQQEVSDCVADEGYEYSTEEDLYERFNSEIMVIENSIDHPGEDLTEDDFGSLSPEELEEIFNQPRILSEEALATLAGLQQEEIELAVVVNDCNGGFANQGRLFQEILAEYEQDFLDQNEDRLAEFKAAG